MEKNKIQPSTLYLVATPIGNLEDITLRALKVLRDCDFIAAEDTRVTAKLLSAYEIAKPMISYEKHRLRSAGEEILRRLGEGKSCALVTDAGTPAISDPGEELVALCLARGFAVVPIPGPCAAITALILSGLPTGRFVFEGFPDGKPGEKRRVPETLEGERRTMIFYEAPHRLARTTAELAEVFGPSRRAVFCRELTKLNEEAIRLTLGEARERFAKETPRGEFVIIVEGRPESAGGFWEGMSIPEHVAWYRETLGLDRMAAIKAAAKDRGLPKNEVYRALLGD